jgi:feruloyl esterase
MTETFRARVARRVSPLVLCAVVTACGGGGDGDPGFVDTSALPLKSPTSSCATLAGKTIAASSIGLPSSGATITSAKVVPAAPEIVGQTSVTHALPEYCEILASIKPVDPAAPPIQFQVNVPTQWNQKIIQVGGGGLDGSIPNSLSTLASAGGSLNGSAFPPDAQYPLFRGYAMFGGDSGHQDPGNTATWALNDEAWQNFGHASLKKTHDAAFAVIELLYGQKPRVSYFMGQSQGGREAMEVAQRYPSDYDGVVATSPLVGYVSHVVHKTLLATVQTGAGWIPASKGAVVASEVMRQCDALDGLNDGVIGNYLGCSAMFDPAKVAQPFAAIRCADGADLGNSCLSDAQIATINQMHAPTSYGFQLANGWTSFPGYGVGQENSGWLRISPQPSQLAQPALGQPGATVSYGILKDPSFNLVNFTIAPFAEKLKAASAIMDTTNPDLGPFFARGGRLIIKVQSSDYQSNPRSTMSYYDAVVAKFGQRQVDEHVRLYVLPNGNHGGSGQSLTTGEPIPQYVDTVAMATNWVEKGIAPPDAPVLTNQLALPPYTTLATKPICRYPAYPRYVGGDAKSATSYRCAVD